MGGRRKKDRKCDIQGGKNQEEIHTGITTEGAGIGNTRCRKWEVQTSLSPPPPPQVLLPPAHWNDSFQLESFQVRGPYYF